MTAEPTVAPHPAGRFVRGETRAEVAVAIVTYNNEDDVDGLLTTLRAEAESLRIRLVIVDNDSADETVQRLSTAEDATVLSAGANLGYAGGVNLALRAIPEGEPVFVVNPDLEVEHGCISALLSRMRVSGAGVVAPRVLDFDGRPFRSLRREAALPRALGDALLGGRWVTRPGWLSEEVGSPRSYEIAQRVDWASGAALLLHPDVIVAVGEWDESFFLYSEETDLQRRARSAGYATWYEPAAVVRHRQGASGASRELLALMAVNRIRYREKHDGKLRTIPYRAVVALHELIRSRSAEHRYAFRTVLHRGSWRSLPQAQTRSEADRSSPATGTIIIPAHNEETTIHRSLQSASALVEESVEVIVACNGCSDRTAEVARRYAARKPALTVIELEIPSKVAALNAADALASHASRIYLDADIEVTPEALRSVLRQLNDRTADGGPVCEAARPAAHDETGGASWLIRSHYRARARMARPRRALWGAGVYGLNEAGRHRFAAFPDVIADDLFIDQLIPDDRRVIVDTTPVVVVTPRNARSLIGVLRRGIRAKAAPGTADTTAGTVRELAGTVRGPASALDAAVFAGFAIAARWSARQDAGRGSITRWERDVSSR